MPKGRLTRARFKQVIDECPVVLPVFRYCGKDWPSYVHREPSALLQGDFVYYNKYLTRPAYEETKTFTTRGGDRLGLCMGDLRFVGYMRREEFNRLENRPRRTS